MYQTLDIHFILLEKVMNKITPVLLLMLISNFAFSQDKTYCGKVKHVSNHHMSSGFLSVIGLRLEGYEKNSIYLYDKRDIQTALEHLVKLESHAQSADINNLNFSQNPTESYYFYTNYKLRNQYIACATVYDPEDDTFFDYSRDFKFYRRNGPKLELIFQRD